MIDWACDAAQREDGRVLVFDRGGIVENVYRYFGGMRTTA